MVLINLFRLLFGDQHHIAFHLMFHLLADTIKLLLYGTYSSHQTAFD